MLENSLKSKDENERKNIEMTISEYTYSIVEIKAIRTHLQQLFNIEKHIAEILECL